MWKSLTAATGVTSDDSLVNEAVIFITNEDEALAQDAKNDEEEETKRVVDSHDDGVSWASLNVAVEGAEQIAMYEEKTGIDDLECKIQFSQNQRLRIGCG